MDWASGRHEIAPDAKGTAGGAGRDRRRRGGPVRVTIAADWMPRARHGPRMRDDPAGYYGDLLPHLQSSDLRLVNVECVVGHAGQPIPKAGPNLRADERAVASLSVVPFDVACLANNHVLDFGPDGLDHMMACLSAAGMQTVGAGTTGDEAAAPFVTSSRGTSIAIVNCAEGEECRSVDGSAGAHGFDVPTLTSQIGTLKQAGHVVIVVFHGGREYVPVPPPYVVRDLRALAASGADLVVGHHPHVPQGIEIHGTTPIAYSLGNFAFYFETPNRLHHLGYLLHADIEDGLVRTIELVPYEIHPDGLRCLDTTTREVFDGYMSRVSSVLASDESVRQSWDAVVRHYVTPDWVHHRLMRGLTGIGDGDVRAIAALGNAFTTRAHSELFSRGLARMAAGTIDDVPPWAAQLLDDYLHH